MGDGWDQARSDAKKASTSGGMFIRLQDDGDSFMGALVGPPKVFTTTFRDSGKTSVRALFNVFVPGQGMKVWEANKATFDAIDKLRMREVGGKVLGKIDLTRCMIEVTRNGVARDTKTTYLPGKGDPITEELWQQIQKTTPHDLTKLALAAGGEEPNQQPARPARSEPAQERPAPRTSPAPVADEEAF